MTGYTFNQLFDFTRTTSATFVGSNGLIQTTPASVNLLTYTQEFDNAAWTKTNATVTANSLAAPDGTMTADTLVEDVTSGSHGVNSGNVTVALGSVTWSVFAKAGTRSWMFINAFAGSNNRTWFNLANGTVGTTGAGATASVTDAGNGWYRCSVTLTSGTTTVSTAANAASADSTTSYSGTASAPAIYLWGAQLEVGSTATTYTRNNGGLYPARFDYDPVTLAPKGILIEEQRVNLALQSQTFDNAAWPKNGITVTANAATSPDGSSNAEAITENTANTTHQLFQNVSFTSGVAYTASVYVKQSVGTRRLNIALGSAPFGAELYATYNLSTLAIAVSAGVTASMENVGNGWYRCRMTATATATATDGFIFRLGNSDAATFFSYTGDGTSTILLYGAQLEAGAFATSYIPTVASQVTRSADGCSIVAPMFAPWYNQTQGTFVAEFSCASNSSVLSADDGTNSNFVRIGRLNLNGRLRVFSGGVEQADVGPANVAGWSGTVKEAATYNANDFAATVNGGVVSSDTSGSVPTVTQLRIGTSGLPDFINGHIRSIKYYPFRASNNQLQVLTT